MYPLYLHCCRCTDCYCYNSWRGSVMPPLLGGYSIASHCHYSDSPSAFHCIEIEYWRNVVLVDNHFSACYHTVPWRSCMPKSIERKRREHDIHNSIRPQCTHLPYHGHVSYQSYVQSHVRRNSTRSHN